MTVEVRSSYKRRPLVPPTYAGFFYSLGTILQYVRYCPLKPTPPDDDDDDDGRITRTILF